jgi:hypothetical protein
VKERKRIIAELDNRYLEVRGDMCSWLKESSRLIIDSGWDSEGAYLNISTAPLKSQHWPNKVKLSADDWRRAARQISKILRRCERGKRLKP